MDIFSPIRTLLDSLTPYFVYILFSATIGPLLFGYHLAELNAPQDVISCAPYNSLTPSLPQCIPMDSTKFGLVSSMFTLGGLLGALASGPLAAKYGRLRTMRLNTIFFMLGGICEAVAGNVAALAIGRVISGLGAGAAVVVVPIYISETAPPSGKGFFGAFTQVMINVGIFVAQLLGLFLSKGNLWRIILGVGGAFGLLQLGALAGAVESPKWLADRGAPTTAKRNLRKIRGRRVNIEEEVSGWGVESRNERNEEQESLLYNEDRMSQHSGDERQGEMAKTETVGILGVISQPQYYKATIAVVVIMLAQQLCGINSIVMYGVGLLTDIVDASSALVNVLVALLNVFLTFVCSPLIDRLGRKICLLMSIIGMGSSSLGLGLGIFFQIPPLSVVAVFAFVASFAVGLGPVPFILSSELTGPEAVGATQSWALAANWIATFIVAQFFPIVNKQLGRGRVYFIFAGFAAFFAIFTAWYIPETKGAKTLDDIWGPKGAQQEAEGEERATG